MKTNYHTHNYRCNHAIGTVDEYVHQGIKAGLDELGFSDHMPHPGKNIDNKNRMKYEDLSEFFKEVDEAKEKYKDKIIIKKGMECEYFEDYPWLYEELREKHKVDYLILGVHFFPYKGEWLYVGGVDLDKDMLEAYTDYVVKSMESEKFLYIAHPDLFGVRYRDFDEHAIRASRRILETAEKLDMPIEINVNGLRKPRIEYNLGERYKYPMEDFWKLSKEYKVRRIIGIDAHKPEELLDRKMGEDFAKKLGLEIIEKINF